MHSTFNFSRDRGREEGKGAQGGRGTGGGRGGGGGAQQAGVCHRSLRSAADYAQVSACMHIMHSLDLAGNQTMGCIV